MAITLTNLREYGVFTEHTDSVSLLLSSIDGTSRIHGLGGAPQAAAVGTKHHHIFNTDGTLVTRYTAPWPADSELLVSTVKANRLVVMGSINSQEIWEFNYATAGYASGSWSQITSSYSGTIGIRAMAPFCDLGGWFYVLGGWGGTDVYKTQNFTAWTLVGSLPAAISRLSGCGFCVHNSVMHLIGGATRLGAPYGLTEFYAAERLGHHYTFDGTTFTLVETDAVKFGHIWGDLASDGTNLYYARGYQVNNNERGILKSTDDGATWSALTPLNDGVKWFNESHRRGALSTSGTAYFFGGNFMNDAWKITP